MAPPPKLHKYLLVVRATKPKPKKKEVKIVEDNSKTAQTDEEKQRERQRNEREQKQQEQDAINYKRDKEAKEAKLLDLEIRRANEKDRKSKEHHLKSHQQQPSTHHQFIRQQSHSETSTPTSVVVLTPGSELVKSPPPLERNILPPAFRSKSLEKEREAFEEFRRKQVQLHQQQLIQQQQQQLQLQQQQPTASGSRGVLSTTPSPQTVSGPPPSVAGHNHPTAAAATAAIIPILPLGVAALRDDSTESDQSLTYSQPHQPDVYHRIVDPQPYMGRDYLTLDYYESKTRRPSRSSSTNSVVESEINNALQNKKAAAQIALANELQSEYNKAKIRRSNSTAFDTGNEELKPMMCRAPIASLDCMEEFSGTGGHLDFGRSISLGSNPALPLRHGTTPTPGLRYKNLGKSGLRVSNVGLGTWPVFSPGVADDQSEAIIKLAVESGINIFDISEAHSETEMGKILQRMGWKRTSFVITTKIYWSTKSEERGLSRKHIIESIKASLERLQLPYIDIVIIHKCDAMCPMEEVVRAMHYCIQQGWMMYWGTARWSQVEVMEAYTNARQFNCITPIVEQSEYHMFCREKCELHLPEMYNKIGVGLMAWGPLSMALSDTQNGDKILFPKGSFKTKSHSYSWTEDETNKNQGFGWKPERTEEVRSHSDRLRDLSELAEKLGCSPAQLSIAWSLKHEPVQCLLLGATSSEQLHQSLQALQLLPRLSVSVMLELERILENKPIRPPMISTLALR